MEHHILVRVVGMGREHMEQGNDMVLGLGGGKQVLGDMGLGTGGRAQHGVGVAPVHGRARRDVGVVLVRDRVLARDILDEVDGILAFLEVDQAWRIRVHYGILQHQNDHMFLYTH